MDPLLRRKLERSILARNKHLINARTATGGLRARHVHTERSQFDLRCKAEGANSLISLRAIMNSVPNSSSQEVWRILPGESTAPVSGAPVHVQEVPPGMPQALRFNCPQAPRRPFASAACGGDPKFSDPSGPQCRLSFRIARLNPCDARPASDASWRSERLKPRMCGCCSLACRKCSRDAWRRSSGRRSFSRRSRCWWHRRSAAR